MCDVPLNGSRRPHASVAFFGDTVGEGSFYRTNSQILRAFRHVRMTVRQYGRYAPLNRGDPSDVCLIHPGWSAGAVNGISGVRKLYGAIGMWDVLNYSAIGPKARAILDSGFYDFIGLSCQTELLESLQGGPTKVMFVEQGVAREFSPYAHPLASPRKRRWRPRILCEAWNPSLLRKGHDIHARALALLQKRGYDFQPVVHGPPTPALRKCFSEVKNIWLVPGYVNRERQRRLWDSCDVLLHLSRGGGAELMPAEAMARGLIPVIPEREPMLRYAGAGAFMLVAAHDWKMSAEERRVWDYGLDAGHGYEVEPEDAADAVGAILDNFQAFRTVATASSYGFWDAWSMDEVMKRNLFVLLDSLKISPVGGAGFK